VLLKDVCCLFRGWQSLEVAQVDWNARSEFPWDKCDEDAMQQGKSKTTSFDSLHDYFPVSLVSLSLTSDAGQRQGNTWRTWYLTRIVNTSWLVQRETVKFAGQELSWPDVWRPRKANLSGQELQKFYDRSPCVIVKHVTIGDKSGHIINRLWRHYLMQHM